MKILPREHGATVIWFVAILASVFSISYTPSILRIFMFLIVATAILMLTSYLMNVAPTIIKIRKNRFLLPIISSILTLITPLGHYIMFGTINGKIFSVWIFLLTYTIFSVVLIQRKILSLIQRSKYTSLFILFGSIIIFSVETFFISLFGWMHQFIVLTTIPLIVMWFYLRSQHISDKFLKSKKKAIRSIGIFQTINMVFFIILLIYLAMF